MDRSKVIVIPCDSYDEEKVYNALKKGLLELGGLKSIVKPEEKILVKPNLLSAAIPDKAVTTHPSVLKAVYRLLSECGCENVKSGDSPGHGSCEGAMKLLGLNDDTMYGAKLTPMSENVHVDFSDGITCKEFDFCKEVVESDAIINVCKMKTHALERITGAVKNVYGFVCGYRKAAGHVKFPNDTVFARMLADIHRCTHPRLHIMDGIIAMEGNGPGAGTPTPMNVILISQDPVALDTVYCYLINLDSELVPTNSQGCRMGIGTDKEDEIEIILCDPDESNTGTSGHIINKNELFEKYGNAAFDVGREKPKNTFLMKYSGFMTKLARRPVIDKEKCVKCGICVDHCPVPGKAVEFKNGKSSPPVYDYKKCIRCYCCQEMCPQHAIRPVRGPFRRH
jgi:uncharacterized protein (DUF362 family)/Pyruvate/2-oxoacid:ferredoxin oxidoreductase delta subunit